MQFSYNVTASDVPNDESPTIAVFWAKGDNDEPIGSAVFSQAINKAAGTYGPITAAIDFSTAPADATKLICVADPNKVADEMDEGNDTDALDLPDISIDAVYWHADLSSPALGGIDFSYDVTVPGGAGLPDSVNLAVYWAADKTFASKIGDAVYSLPADTSAGHHRASVTKLDLKMPSDGANYLIVVADPESVGDSRGTVAESRQRAWR